MDIGNTDSVKMTLIPKDNTKSLNKKPSKLPLKHYAWLRKELTNLEKKQVWYTPRTSNTASSNITVLLKKNPSMHKFTNRMAVDIRKINKQLENWSDPLMRIDRIFSHLNDTQLFSTLGVKSSYFIISQWPRTAENILPLQLSMANMNSFKFHLEYM